MEFFLQLFSKSTISSEKVKEKKRINSKKKTQELLRAHNSETKKKSELLHAEDHETTVLLY